MSQAALTSVLRDGGPLTGAELLDKTGLEALELWRACATAPGLISRIVGRRFLRLDRVVRTFLDFTRPVELKWDNVPMQELVREIVDLARPQTAVANIEVSVRQEADGVEVRVDRDLV